MKSNEKETQTWANIYPICSRVASSGSIPTRSGTPVRINGVRTMVTSRALTGPDRFLRFIDASARLRMTSIDLRYMQVPAFEVLVWRGRFGPI